MTKESIEELKKMTLQIPAELHRRLKESAAHDDKTITDIIQKLIQEYLDKRENKK